MPPISPDSAAAIQSELMSGETIEWAGQPKPGMRFHRGDLYMVPFSLFFCAFSLFWEGAVSGWWNFTKAKPAPGFFIFWGVPFVLAGQYMLWGRFAQAEWLKKRTYYAITNRRVIAVQTFWSRQTSSCFLDALPTLTKDSVSGDTGTLRFAPTPVGRYQNAGFAGWNPLALGEVPNFVDVQDVDSLYRLVSDLREKSRGAKATF